MVAHANAEISAAIGPGSAANHEAASAPWLPLNAALDLDYDAPHSTLTLTNSRISSDQTSVLANGTISGHSTLSLQARSSNLHETELLIAAARNILSAAGEAPFSAGTTLDVRGRASADAQIRGQIQNPRITGHAEADALKFGGKLAGPTFRLISM